MWQNWLGNGDDTDRGASPIVGIVVLVGMVLLGAILVFVVGSAMFDAIGSEVDREKVHMCMDEADHRLGTVAATRTEQPMAFDDPDCQPEVVAEGTLEITWFNSSAEEDPPWENRSRTVSEDLGALEFELDDRTIAHQGGGIWELTGSGSRIVKAPDIGFDGNETVQLDFMQLDSIEAAGSQSKAQHDYESASSAVENLTSAIESSDEDDFALRIESKYAEAWERHLEREADDVDGSEWDVDVTREGDTVVMVIEDLGGAPSDPHFVIERDNGLTAHDEATLIDNNRVEAGTTFHVGATLKNVGEEAGSVTADLRIWNESEEWVRQIESKSPNEEIESGGTIETDAQETWEVTDNASEHSFDPDSLGLEPGTEYEYDIETDPGGDSLDEKGTFLVVDELPEFDIQNVDIDGPATPRESLTVEVRIKNQGERFEQFVWLEGFDGNVVDIGELELDRNEQQTVTLEWGSVGVPATPADAEITVGTETDSATEDVDVDPLLDVTDVAVLDDPIEEGDSVTVEADLEAIGGEARQDVVLEGFDGNEVDRQRVRVSDSETVELEYDGVGERTDRVTVRTDDDETDEVVVVERDGPVCGTVDYDGSGTESDPYQVSTVDQLQCINDQGLDAHYELIDDIDAHGTEYWNDGDGFEPIGPRGNIYPQNFYDPEVNWETFGGTFDGNGYLIDGLYIDRPSERFVGLFGATDHPWSDAAVGHGSKIVNVRLADVYIHGKQHVGGLVGQAGGTVIESRSEGYVEAEEQLVGGLIGDGVHADIDNELVAEGTVVGGNNLDGMNGEGIGGLIGRSTWNTEVSTGYTQNMTVEYRPDGPPVDTNTHTGGIVGTSSYRDSTFEQMYSTATVDGYHGDAGAIVGTVLSGGDHFRESVYWNEEIESDAKGEDDSEGQPALNWIGLTTDEMRHDTTDQMDNLRYEDEGGPWVAIPDDYPRFAWELEAEGVFEVEIDDVENVTAGEAATIDATVTSRYQDPDEEDVTQTITLTAPDGQIVDTEQVTLESSLDEEAEKEISLVWQTGFGDDGIGDVTVQSEDRDDSVPIEIESVDDRRGSSDSSIEDILGGDSDIDIDVDAIEVS